MAWEWYDTVITTDKMREDHLLTRIAGMIKRFHYMKDDDTVNHLCLLQGHITACRRKTASVKEAEFIKVEKQLVELQTKQA